MVGIVSHTFHLAYTLHLFSKGGEFKYWNSAVRHALSKGGNVKWICSICEKSTSHRSSFSRSNSAQAHLKKKHGEFHGH
ncbi:hypothetical protein M422DRAFT_250024 [Sphaerobolus stellatus SS14]|nr:hypothetical protein M422DRAFT_250024 [Sphaerobolus stellatus SS14]